MGIGFIRLLLVLIVVSLHSQLPIFGCMPFQGHGNVAVFSFFIIAGFYTCLILEEKYLDLKNGVRLYYTNRFLRIFPMYFLIILLSFIGMQFLGGTSITFWTQPTEKFYQLLSQMDLYQKSILIFSNVFIFFSDMFVKMIGWSTEMGWTRDRTLADFTSGHYFILFPPAWSLSVELFYYFIAPIFVRRKSLFFLLILLTFQQPLLFSWSPFSQYFSAIISSYFLYFGLGMLAYQLYVFLKPYHHKIFIYLGQMGAGALLGLCLFSNLFISNIQITYFLFITILFFSLPFLFSQKNNKIDQFLANLSYPVYISHFVVYKYLEHWFSINLFNYFVSLILFSIVLTYLVEIPLLKIRQALIRRKHYQKTKLLVSES